MALHLNFGQFTQRGAFTPQPASYLPSDNPTSLVAWFRKGVGVTSSGGFASRWADQSGNGRDLIQNTGTNQPAYDGSAILTFDGVDNFMACATFTFNQPEQVSMLVNQITWGGNYKCLFDGNTDDRGQVLQWVSYTTPDVGLYSGGEAARNANLTLNTWHALTALFNGASSSLLIDATTPTTGNPGATNNMAGFKLATAGSSPGYYTNIAVKEIILRNVNDATIRAADHAYLQTL